MAETLPCIICDKELESALNYADSNFINQPYAATAFTSSGHYGSTFFDPFSGDYLELNICDLCLTARRDKLRVVRPAPRIAPEITVLTYDEWTESQ